MPLLLPLVALCQPVWSWGCRGPAPCCLSAGSPSTRLPLCPGDVNAVMWVKGGSGVLASGSADGSVQLFDASCAVTLTIADAHSSGLMRASHAPCCAFLAAIVLLGQHGATIPPCLSGVSSLDIRGGLMVTGGKDRYCRMWDFPAGTPTGVKMYQTAGSRASCVTPPLCACALSRPALCWVPVAFPFVAAACPLCSPLPPCVDPTPRPCRRHRGLGEACP